MTALTSEATISKEEIKEGIKSLCAQYPESYWRKLDETHTYPEQFVAALTEGGWLSMLIPQIYGGLGLGMADAAIVLEEINRSGGYAAPAHAQMYTMGALLRHGSVEQKEKWLPEIAKGRVRLQAFGVTEPKAGSDTTSIATMAERVGDKYVINGEKIFISRVQHSDVMMLLARTSPQNENQKKTEGLSLILIDLQDENVKKSMRVKQISTMVNHETNDIFLNDVVVPVENRIGEEGKGFRYILSGMNAERILVSSESIGDGRYFIDKASDYARNRIVFGRPIGQNQGIQFPIAKAYVAIEAASRVRDNAATLFDKGASPGADANMAKYLASQAAWEAANVAMDTFGGYGYAVEYNIERKFREARLALVAPISSNMILSYVAEHVLGLPRSY